MEKTEIEEKNVLHCGWEEEEKSGHKKVQENEWN